MADGLPPRRRFPHLLAGGCQLSFVLHLLGSLLLIGATGCQSCKVVRVNDGRASCGREIESEAYAAYARGRLAELQGNRETAAREYERVVDLDGNAGEAWIRLGALECRTDPKAAEHAWSKALETAEGSHLLWLERARCAIDGGDLKNADLYARRALQLGPTDSEVTLQAARIASRLGDTERETTLLLGALAVQPGNAALWTALATSPTATAVDRKHAVRRLLRIRPIDASWVPPTYLKTNRADSIQRLTVEYLREQLELALARRDATEASRVAALLGVSAEQLAVAALDAGFYSLALQQAEVLLALNPNDVAAWVIALVSADLSGSGERFRELLTRAPSQPTAPGGALLAALFRLVERAALP